MPRISPMTPHEFCAEFIQGDVPTRHVNRSGEAICVDCGGLPSAPQHWNQKTLQVLGPMGYHHWYYNNDIWRHVTFMGVYAAKNVLDLWNYQEIMWELKPGLVVEFGMYAGGTALYLGWIMQCVNLFGNGPIPRVLTVDQDHSRLHPFVKRFNIVETWQSRSTNPDTHDWIKMRLADSRHKGEVRIDPVLLILDSDHSKANVLAELEMLRELTRPGDYIIVEDSNINGHPVLPGWGDGPWEAIEEYERLHPDDYEHDTARENKFGMTFNPKGYLRRK